MFHLNFVHESDNVLNTKPDMLIETLVYKSSVRI